MKKIKVLYIVPSLKLCNGVASYAMNYYRNINNENIQIDFIETANVKSEYFDEIEKRGGKVFSFPRMGIRNAFKVIKQIKDFYNNNINQYQIVHCNVVNSGVFFLYYAKKYNIKYRILHSHSNKYSDKFLKNIRNTVLAYFAKKYANIYCACSKLAGTYMFQNNNYKIVNNAIDIEKFKYNAQIRKEIRRIEGIQNDEYLIGNVGRLSSEKNQIFLIKLFKEYLNINPKSKLLLIGTGNLEEKIKNEVEKNGLKDKVILKKDITNVNEYLQAVDVFVLPSIYEGLPVVGIEAQTAGLPCLFSNNITKEIKLTDTCEFLELNDKKQWIQALEKYKYTNRKIDKSEIIKQRGYEIKNESLILEKYYKEILEEI